MATIYGLVQESGLREKIDNKMEEIESYGLRFGNDCKIIEREINEKYGNVVIVTSENEKPFFNFILPELTRICRG